MKSIGNIICCIFILAIGGLLGWGTGFAMCLKAWDNSVSTQYITASVSGYCICAKCTAPYNDGITASGIRVTRGMKLAAHRSLPFGTKIDVPGYGQCEVQDRFGREDSFDLLFDTHEEAIIWGRQELEVMVVR